MHNNSPDHQWLISEIKSSDEEQDELELKVFYQTHTACKPPSACTAVNLSPPKCDTMLLSATACSIRCKPCYALSMGMTPHFFVFFCPWWPWPLTLTFRLVRARDQTRLTCKFGTNPFSRSRYIWVTNKVTDGAKNRTLLACRGTA